MITDVPQHTKVRWGREVTRGEANGHPCLVYTDRPKAFPDLLISARKWSDRTYLVQGERRISGAEHEAAVARVARHLASLGITAGDRVVILGFNSIEWVVSFWAAQSLGAVTVLGNAWWSDTEVAEALESVEPALIISHRAFDAPFLSFEDVRTLVENHGDLVELPVWDVDEDDLAVIMFSSGTTGAPKGVQMSHRSLVGNIHNLLALTGRLPDELDLSHPGTVSLLSVPLFHLAGIQVCVSNLVSGGRLVFLTGKFNPREVLGLIEKEKIRTWGSIPTMVSRVLDSPDFDDFDTSSVKSIPMGGSAVSAELKARVAEKFSLGKKKSSSLYGLTEAGGVLAAGSGASIEEFPGCVGHPLPVVEIRIEDEDAEGAGRILTRTPTMTHGYLGDPRSIVDAEGWLDTGDLGRLDTEGRLYLTGRSKDIIIRGGENISAAHVEHALHTHPDVLEVVVVALPHPDLGEEVGAVVMIRPQATVTPHDLATHAGASLGKYQIPSQWQLREDPLPTNATGKVARAQIREDWLAARRE